MKKNNVLRISLILGALFVSVGFFGTAKAANEIPVTLRIENETATDLIAEIQVPDECTVTDSSAAATVFTGYKAICVLQAAQDQGLLTYQVTNWGFAFALDSINSTANATDWSSTWLLFQNLKDPGVGIDGVTVAADDELLLSYGAWPKQPITVDISSPTVMVGDDITFTAKVWNDTDAQFEQIPGATTFYINGSAFPSLNGTLTWNAPVDGTFTVSAEADMKTRSALSQFTVTPLPAPKQVQLRIETDAGTELSKTVATPYACDVSDSASVVHHFTGYKAICTLEQAKNDGILRDFQVTDWGFAFALDSVNGLANATDWSTTWLLFQNLKDPGVGIDSIILDTNDELLLSYNAWPAPPLHITTSNTTPTEGDTLTLSIEFWDSADNTWKYYTATSSTVMVNTSVYETASGTVDIVVPAGTSLITATAPQTTKSALLSITAGTPPTPPSTFGGGGGGTINPVVPQFSTPSALNYIFAAQQVNGSMLNSPLYSDWAALALRATSDGSTQANALKQYLLSDPSPTGGPNETTDYERRAIALMALGINPYTGTATNYIDKILSRFKDGQFVDQTNNTTLVNDDIFGLIALLHAGYSASDAMIASSTQFLVGQQDADGSWGSVDLTAAAVQALSPVSSVRGVSEALTKAKQYLTSNQNANGGWGNNDSTSWAMLGIGALNEQPSNWSVGSNTPLTYLAGQQTSDGGVGNAALPQSARVWSTIYALTSMNAPTWASLLYSFDKPISPPPQNSSTGGGDIVLPVTPTSTPVIVATSTEPILTPTSTEPAVLGIKVEAELPILEPVVVTHETVSETLIRPTGGSTNRTIAASANSEMTAGTRSTSPETAPETSSTPKTTITQSETISRSTAAKVALGASVTVGTAAGAYLIWRLLAGLL